MRTIIATLMLLSVVFGFSAAHVLAGDDRAEMIEEAMEKKMEMAEKKAKLMKKMAKAKKKAMEEKLDALD